MLKNYIKIAWRNFLRNKSYSLINVLGLAIGLACLILISLFVTDELSYDRFHKESDQIYFIGRESHFGGNISRGLSTPYPVGQAMKEEIPEVEYYLVTMWPGSGAVSLDGQDYATEDRIMMSTENFFQVFSFPLKVGNPETVLASPNSVVLTEEMAQKYFGDKDPVGKTIVIKRYGDEEYTITGIAEDMRHNSYVNFDFVTSIQNSPSVEKNRESWRANMFNTYVKLEDRATWEQVEPKVTELVEKNLGEESNTNYFSIPVTELYLSELASADGFKGSMKYVYIFSAIALFILILACINYMNLATARATQRAQEVGVRKVVGAGKGQLVSQFISEAVIIAIAAFLLGLLFAELALPYFNNFIDKELTLNLANNGVFISSLFSISIIVGILSGSYPAFFLTRFKPAMVLKREAYKSLSGSVLRKSLVVAQFAISTILIIGTLVAYNQLNFVMEKDLGFQDEQVIYIPAYQIQDQVEVFKQKAISHSSILEASAASGIPGEFSYRISQPFDPQNPDNKFSAYLLRSDSDYDKVLGLDLVAGRYFDKNRSTDRNEARVINEAMLEELGWESADKAVGRTFRDSSRVVGVVENFHFKSLHSKIGPVYIRMKPTDADQYNGYSILAIRFNPEQVSEVISHLEEVWSTFDTGNPMIYHFLDEKFAEQYETDQKLSQAFLVFAGIAIFIACLGLFGLAAFSAERRTKEIGIRKVLGATVSNIVALLSRDFVKLVILGFVVATPIAWYTMNQWLADFAYRIEIGPGIFALAGGAALLIALLTVSWQSIRAAVANPVDSLRSE